MQFFSASNQSLMALSRRFSSGLSHWTAGGVSDASEVPISRIYRAIGVAKMVVERELFVKLGMQSLDRVQIGQVPFVPPVFSD